ncbi:nitroreductase family protein [Candidatus Bathyarchaeota archaeon]|nr:nitroreductase family protein [Candidatus Bathyarchaeota archaeon]
MDLFEAITKRRSIRIYDSKPIPENTLNKILNVARWAPSAGNRQPWELIVVSDGLVKRYLREAALGQRFIEEAPVTIVACANEARSAGIYGDRGRQFYCLLDVAAAVQNILLAAHAVGLGACWVGAFDDETVRNVLNLPPEVRPIAIVTLGYPNENPPPPPRTGLKDILHTNRY